MENKNKPTDYQKLSSYSSILPECFTPYLLQSSNQRALSTRIRYAEEYIKFFSWLKENHPDFCIYDKISEIPTSLLSKISSQNISLYITQFLDEQYAERTVALKRNALSSFFNYMVDNRLLEYNPVVASAKVVIHKSDTVTYLNIEEQNRFLDAIYTGAYLTRDEQKYHERLKLRDVAIVSLMLDTGMRVSELRGINIIDLDFSECSVIVTRKGGSNQTLFYSDETSEKLQEYLEERRSWDYALMVTDPLFVSTRNERLTTNGIWRMVKKYATSALPGIGSKISPHKLRSSFAMELYRASKDILLVQRSLGHKNLTATNIYAKATDEELKEARNILSEIRNTR